MKENINLICPQCGAKFTLAEAVEELEQMELHDIASKFGQSWRLIYEYTDCFRKSETGGMQRAKRLRLLKEISRLFDTCEFQYEGKRWRTTWPEVIVGITETCNMDLFKFKNHNYLKAILVKTAKRVSAEGMTAEEEAKGERQKAQGEKTKEEFLEGAPEKARERIHNILNNLGDTHES